ncbi:energy transducer TonB [Pseudoxanthomonas koreensis]|uniref:energy transducer TonB n=1 Tax=Pseudoxanthomonas koreensis TaxID=266061 RepID=UPI0035A5ED60
MTTQTPSPHPHPQTAHADAEPTRPPTTSQRAPVSLLVVLAITLVALGAWWYSQTSADRADQGFAPASTSETAPDAASVTATDRPATGTGDSTRPANPDRAPRPLADNAQPRYPATALRDGIEASVVLSIVVDANGVPAEIAVVEREGARDHALDRAAVQAARQWRFEPAIRDGRPAQATVRVPVEFRRG